MKDQEYVSGFIQAIGTVFESFSERHIVCKEYRVLRKGDCGGDISVTIDFQGDVRGSFYMSMNSHIGQRLASELLGGIEINEINELVTSAVSELGNMIMGNACSNLSSGVIQMDITPPTVFLGDVIAFEPTQTFYNIPVELENLGTIDFDVTMKTA